MPLSRIALQSPAGAARGQVLLLPVMPWKAAIYTFHVCRFLVLVVFTNLYKILWQADDIQNEANELLRIKDYLYNELAKNTGQPVEKVS